MHDFGFFPESESWWPIVIATLVTLVVAIRWYAGGQRCPSQHLMESKIVLVTEASSQLGLAIAAEMAHRRAQIILACRDRQKGLNAKNHILRLRPSALVDVKIFNLSLQRSVILFTNDIKNVYNRIDVLINCSDINLMGSSKTTQEEFELTCAINYLGPFLLTHLLLPLLANSDNGRIINVSSYLHQNTSIDQRDLVSLTQQKRFEGADAYEQSKLAVVLFTRHLAQLLKNTHITVYAANPGSMRDAAILKSSKLLSSSHTKLWIRLWIWLFTKTPKQSAQTILYLAVEPTLNKTTGGYYTECKLEQPSNIAQDDSLAEDLYQRTCEECKIDGKQLISKLPTVKHDM